MTPLTPGHWEELIWSEPFSDLAGPIWFLQQGTLPGERMRVGIEVAEKHCNRIGSFHGAMLSALADYALGLNAAFVDGTDNPGPTISLSLDFVRPVLCGDWAESRTEIIRATRSLVFVEGRIMTHKGICARANAVFSRPQTHQKS